MDEEKKMTLKQADILLCYLMSEGVKVDQIDMFYRENRDAQLRPLHTIHDDFTSAEHAIPDFILKQYGKSPVGMFQVKYTGSKALFGRIIVDADRPRYVTPKQGKRKRTKEEYQRMKAIADKANEHIFEDRERWVNAEPIGTIVEE